MGSGGSGDCEGMMGGIADLQGVWAWVCRVGRGRGCGGDGRLLAGLGETWWGMLLGDSESYVINVVIVILNLEASAVTGCLFMGICCGKPETLFPPQLHFKC